MPLNPEEIVALTGTTFVTQVPNIKYRQHGNTLGIIKMFQDRFEWHDPANPEPVVMIPYETISELRVSAPDKPKVQIQAVLVDQEHVNFAFAEPGAGKEQLLESQKRTRSELQKHVNFAFAEPGAGKEQLLESQKRTRSELQSLIVRHRKILKTHEQQMSTATTHELESKRKLLKTSWLLKILYNSLVMKNVMSPEDFWKMYYKPHEATREQAGVSNGFLFDIDIGMSGAVNLSQEVRRQIYKTYPSIERKYIEYVPNTMSEQDFWSKFIQSHYFYRDRNPDYKKNDPISECIQEDEDQLNQNAKKLLHYKKDKDLLNILEDDGFYADKPELFNPALTDKKKLIRRLNDFSDRVLEAALDTQRNSIIDNQSVNQTASSAMEVDNLDDEEEYLPASNSDLTYYVKKPGVAEFGMDPTKIKEIVLPEDLDSSDKELELIDQEGKESDDELDYRPTTYGRDVHSRFIQLRVPAEIFDEVCQELIERTDDNDPEDDYELHYEDTQIAMQMPYPPDIPKPPDSFPTLSGRLVKRLFSANVVVLELSQQARKLMSQKTISATKQVIAVCTALTSFQNNYLSELRDECREEFPGAEKFLEYLQGLIDDVLAKALEFKETMSI
uniref:BSD domain-containing protein n=1 Tax=Panagrolaimus sp. JU765 TaxID=591449 RepID=A0AC34R7T1_9BILA